MANNKASTSRDRILEKKRVHPFALQGLASRDFIRISNKILSGEFGLLSFDRSRKTALTF